MTTSETSNNLRLEFLQLAVRLNETAVPEFANVIETAKTLERYFHGEELVAGLVRERDEVANQRDELANRLRLSPEWTEVDA